MFPAFRAAVVEDVFVVASGILKGIGQDRHPVERLLLVNAASQCLHVRREPRKIDGDVAEGKRTEDVVEEAHLLRSFARTSDVVLGKGGGGIRFDTDRFRSVIATPPSVVSSPTKFVVRPASFARSRQCVETSG